MPTKSELARALRSLPNKKKLILVILLITATLSLLATFLLWNNSTMVEIPKRGGKYYEGVIGAPRFINPLLAISDTDRDLSTLIYSGLLRKDETGQLIPDLAESYEVSADGLTYTFTLRDNLSFHDGVSISAADVAFTVALAQNLNQSGSRIGNWQGISVRAENKRTVVFRLPEAHSSFPTQATLGVLPAHIWKNVPIDGFTLSDNNIRPIGSGPYRLSDIKETSSGLPEYYELKPFSKFTLGTPNIEVIRFYFFANENLLLEAFRQGKIMGLGGIKPETAITLFQAGEKISQTSLPRVFGIFFNQNRAEVLTQKEVRQALIAVVDRDYIVDNILKGYATAIDGPLPPGAFGYQAEKKSEEPVGERLIKAKAALAAAGWQADKDGVLTKKGPSSTYRLEFSITTADIPELKNIALLLKNQWEKLGGKIEIKILDTTDLQQNAIRPRKYDALLFGMATGEDGDLYPFWHSSQRLDPGLNVAMHTSATSDRLLDQIRREQNLDKRDELFTSFYQELATTMPAVFLYSPNFIYITPTELKNFSLPYVNIPADRWLTVYKWYIKTDRVWPMFASSTK